MSPKVNTEDLIDSTEVAEILGLTHRNSVSTYLKRYGDFPRPMVERSNGRTRLWLRQDVAAWLIRRSSDS
jgi:predicted DNA-binding transcriptional regulator AlpA